MLDNHKLVPYLLDHAGNNKDCKFLSLIETVITISSAYLRTPFAEDENSHLGQLPTRNGDKKWKPKKK